MNNVIVNAQEMEVPSWSGSMAGFALKVLEEIERDNWELSFLLCTDRIITELNAKYRNKNEPTDILSFSLGIQDGETAVYLPGDIVISLDTMRENTKYFGVSEDEELRRLVIHGILHLDGMDHQTLNEEKEPMLTLQEKILSRLKDERIFPKNGANGVKT